jgi:hypothetical protein
LDQSFTMAADRLGGFPKNDMGLRQTLDDTA